eukprot:398704-Rhodomonas_salina.1
MFQGRGAERVRRSVWSYTICYATPRTCSYRAASRSLPSLPRQCPFLYQPLRISREPLQYLPDLRIARAASERAPPRYGAAPDTEAISEM